MLLCKSLTFYLYLFMVLVKGMNMYLTENHTEAPTKYNLNVCDLILIVTKETENGYEPS